MSGEKKIVILGGGYGGVEAAKKLHKKYKKRKEVSITLIDRNPFHTLMTELHEVAGSRVEPDSVQVSFEKIFSGTRVRIVIDRINTIDFEGRNLVSDTAEYQYDYLVLGVGGEPEFYGIKGIKEHSFKLWSLDDALAIREHIDEQFRHAAREHDPKKRQQMLTFTVAGAGFTGIEMIGELIEQKETLCTKYHIDPQEVRLVVIEAMEDILPILPDNLQKKAVNYLTKHGVELLLKSPITEAGEGYVEIKGEEKVLTDTLIWTAGIMGCEFAGNLELTKGKCSNKKCPHATKFGTCGKPVCEFAKGHRYVDGKRGRLLANDLMQSVDHENVYIVGDVVWIMEQRRVVPQIVETALQTAETAAKNIAADIDGKEKEKFKSNYHGFMVSIGGRYGVAHVMGMKLSGIFAMGMKHFVNLHYLFGLAGLNAVWAYLKHEFFDMKDKRTFIGGHLSGKIRLHWTLPLRLFVGAKWLIEGIRKVLDGWLVKGNIFIISTDGGSSASQAVSSAAGGSSGAAEAVTAATGETAHAAAQAAQAAADAATSATHAAAQAAQTVVDAATSASQAAAGAAGDAAAATWATVKPLIAEPTGIYLWLERVLIQHIPFFFQAVVVLAEIGIGLALIGGLFTFLASGASIILGIMFILSAMAGPEILWYIFAAIVLLGGAGKAFGLDHWVMPWIKNWWNGTRLAKRTFLYIDEPRKTKRGRKR